MRILKELRNRNLFIHIYCRSCNVISSDEEMVELQSSFLMMAECLRMIRWWRVVHTRTLSNPLLLWLHQRLLQWSGHTGSNADLIQFRYSGRADLDLDLDQTKVWIGCIVNHLVTNPDRIYLYIFKKYVSLIEQTITYICKMALQFRITYVVYSNGACFEQVLILTINPKHIDLLLRWSSFVIWYNIRGSRPWKKKLKLIKN